jgi:hypothetical protein
MATSGSTTWELNRDQLIQAAMRKLGALGEGQSPTTEDYTNGTVALNGLIASFQTLGMLLWERREFNIPLSIGVDQYNIGVGQTIDTPFPLKVYGAYLVNTSTGQQVEMDIKSVYEWQQIRSNTNSSYPVFITYTPRNNLGVVSVWPRPDATAVSTYSIKLIGQAPVEDVNDSTDTLDFPKEWHNAIIFGLAELLAPEFGTSDAEKMSIERQAKKWLEMAKDFGSDEASVFFQVERN